ncbi:DJ-1/PfpI family protein [Candidatus Woesearchaeota archaeon]|nr:DJ-1/PfpI family protein [Candidatus Woesearchaeota archaeon]
MTQVLFIIAPKDYQDYEYGLPKKILENAGVQVVTASKTVGTCTGSFGDTAEATVALADINVDDYEAIIFVGGQGAFAYQHDVQAHLTAQEAVNRNKILAGICIAPTILAYAGVLENKKATVWNENGEPAKILTDNGATFTDETVTTDGNIITANGPRAAKEFGEAILERLKNI